MNNQNLIVLAIGLFVTLIVAVAAIDEYLLQEHPPSQVGGLIWQVENAFSHVQDLETVLAFAEADSSADPIRVLVRYLGGPTPALSVRYLDPLGMKDQIFTVNHDLLSHYIPSANLVVIKRWVGFPLALLGLAGFDLSQLKAEWDAGDVDIRVLQSIAGFTTDLFASNIAVSCSLSRHVDFAHFVTTTIDAPFCCEATLCPMLASDESGITVGLAQITLAGDATSIEGSYILEVRDADTSALVRMVWIERDTFLIRKVVAFVDGRRESTIRVEWLIVDQGLTEEDILTLPRGAETIRG